MRTSPKCSHRRVEPCKEGKEKEEEEEEEKENNNHAESLKSNRRGAQLTK